MKFADDVQIVQFFISIKYLKMMKKKLSAFYFCFVLPG